MKKIKNFLMLSCKKAASLIDKKSLFGLTWKEKVMLRMHTSMCEFCTAYEKQSKLIDEALHHHIHSDDEKTIVPVKNEELKYQIIHKLNEQ